MMTTRKALTPAREKGRDKMKNRGVVTAILLLTWIVSARADEWPAPRVQNVFSSNGRYFVRIVPATSINRAAGAAGGPNQGKSRGEFYARQPDRSYRLTADVELQNRFSPTYAIVTDDGYLVTFDEWFQMGIGDVMALTVFEHLGGTFQLQAQAGTFNYRSGTAACSPGNATMFR